MTKALYYGIGGALLLGVVVALFLLYKSAEYSKIATPYEVASLQPKQKEEKDFGWLQTLGEAKPLTFSYPIDELNIRISLSEQIQPRRIIQIVVDTVDSYQYFCIIQIFNQMRVNYSILRQEKNFVANLSNLDDLMMDELEKKLNYYQIKFKSNTFYTKDY